MRLLANPFAIYKKNRENFHKLKTVVTPGRLRNRTAVGRLVLYKAFRASLWSALTAPPARCVGLVGFGVREPVPGSDQKQHDRL